MEVISISYFGDDGWENHTDYNHTPSSELHIPRVGDFIKNKYCKTYRVNRVTWNIPTNSVVINCMLVDELI